MLIYTLLIQPWLLWKLSRNVLGISSPHLLLQHHLCNKSRESFSLLKNNFLTWMNYFICYDLCLCCGSYNTTKTNEFLAKTI